MQAVDKLFAELRHILKPGRWKPGLDDGRWTMDDGRWTMDDGRWTMDLSMVTQLITS